MTQPSITPYRDVTEWARQQEELVVLQLEAFALRDLRAGNTADPVKIAEALKSPETIASFVQSLRATSATPTFDGELDELRRTIDARARASQPLPPLDLLAQRLELSSLEVDVLRLLWVMQTAPTVHRFAQAVWHDLTQGPIGLDFVLSALTTRPADRLRLRNLLAPSGTLRKWSLVIATTHRSAYPTVALPEGLLVWLAGAPLAPSGPYRIVRDPPVVQPENLVSQGRWPTLAAALTVRKPRARVFLQAPSNAGVDTLVRGLAGAEPMVIAEAIDLLHNRSDADQLLDHAIRDAILAGGWLCLKVPATWEATASLFIDRAAERLRDAPLDIIVACELISPQTRELTRDYVGVDIGALSSDERAALWREASPVDDALPQPPKVETLRSIFVDYQLPPESILVAAPDATRRAAIAGDAQVKRRAILEACHAQIDAGFSGLATLVPTLFEWSDLIVPDAVSDQLREILSSGIHRATVMNRWGFGPKYPYGSGLTMLFSGPSGTGKTMAASIIAKHLDRPLYRVDLSQVFDRYVGETEKNLARVFDGARAGHAIILFDEADSLFSKRTEVKSSNDRYANLEVNYLLQRLENHQGMVILTTNLDSSLDEAFRRRIRFSVKFPEPTYETRIELWKSMIPEEAQAANDINYEDLAYDYELPGGGIKNAVLRAAFLAAADGVRIKNEHLRRAANAECAALGKLVRGHH